MPPKANDDAAPSPTPSNAGRSTTSQATPPRASPPRNPQPRTEGEYLDRFLGDIGGITDAQRRLFIELFIVNGQDAYDAEAASVGKLKSEEYLALPTNWIPPRVDPDDVGRKDTVKRFMARDLALIYKLNKARAPPGDNAVIYGMLRMEAVKMGWVEGQKEIIYVAPPDVREAITEFTNDLAAVQGQLERLRLAAFLVPLVCENTFRTMGHHYITGLATEYQTRYRKTLRACLAEDIFSLLQPSNLFHHVLHWVSPERSYNVLFAQLNTKTLPDAIMIRANAAPAGWAIVTTTAAVLQAMSSANIMTEVEEDFEGDLDLVRDAAKKIKANPRRWHKAYFAYGANPPTPGDLAKMEEAKEVAISFAPYAQGFIDGTLKDAALGQAMALKKHAELNPIARARSARFFRSLARLTVNSVADLFQTELVKVKKPDEEGEEDTGDDN